MNLVDPWGFPILKKFDGLFYFFNCQYLGMDVKGVYTFTYFS